MKCGHAYTYVITLYVIIFHRCVQIIAYKSMVCTFRVTKMLHQISQCLRTVSNGGIYSSKLNSESRKFGLDLNQELMWFRIPSRNFGKTWRNWTQVLIFRDFYRMKFAFQRTTIHNCNRTNTTDIYIIVSLKVLRLGVHMCIIYCSSFLSFVSLSPFQSNVVVRVRHRFGSWRRSYFIKHLLKTRNRQSYT